MMGSSSSRDKYFAESSLFPLYAFHQSMELPRVSLPEEKFSSRSRSTEAQVDAMQACVRRRLFCRLFRNITKTRASAIVLLLMSNNAEMRNGEATRAALVKDPGGKRTAQERNATTGIR